MYAQRDTRTMDIYHLSALLQSGHDKERHLWCCHGTAYSLYVKQDVTLCTG